MRNQFEIQGQLEVLPFLRWAGGKRWFLKHLHGMIKNLNFNNYHEPFVGSGVVFFYLGRGKKSYLSDLNKDLIFAYKAVKDNIEELIIELKKFKNDENYYYKVRNKHYKDPITEAAKFIYLNQTSFNGIYRVNLKGEYNVPYGFKKDRILANDYLRKASLFLGNAELNNYDFELSKSFIKRNDLLFLDPPYTVSHNNNGFIKYNQKLFSLDDQYRLSKYIDYIKEKGAFYILTNAAHLKIEEIFEKGDKKLILERSSIVGGANAIRGKIKELVITNISSD